MASLVITIENIQPSPLTPLGGGLSDRYAGIQALENILKGLEGGETPVSAAGSPVITISPTTPLGTATATFAGGLTVGDTITIAGQALTATKFNATGTVTSAAPVAGDTVTIQGVVYTFVAGTVATGARTIPVGLGTDTLTAAFFASVVNNDPIAAPVFSASSAAGVITLRATNPGVAGNSLTLASSNGTRLLTSGATMTGGAAITNNAFDPGLTAIQAAANFLAAVNASSTAAVSGNVIAYAGGPTPNIVTLKNRSSGAGGTISLAKTSTNTTISGATIAVGTLSTGLVVNL